MVPVRCCSSNKRSRGMAADYESRWLYRDLRTLTSDSVKGKVVDEGNSQTVKQRG